MDREAWHAAVYGVTKSLNMTATELTEMLAENQNKMKCSVDDRTSDGKIHHQTKHNCYVIIYATFLFSLPLNSIPSYLSPLVVRVTKKWENMLVYINKRGCDPCD